MLDSVRLDLVTQYNINIYVCNIPTGNLSAALSRHMKERVTGRLRLKNR